MSSIDSDAKSMLASGVRSVGTASHQLVVPGVVSHGANATVQPTVNSHKSLVLRVHWSRCVGRLNDLPRSPSFSVTPMR